MNLGVKVSVENLGVKNYTSKNIRDTTEEYDSNRFFREVYTTRLDNLLAWTHKK